MSIHFKRIGDHWGRGVRGRTGLGGVALWGHHASTDLEEGLGVPPTPAVKVRAGGLVDQEGPREDLLTSLRGRASARAGSSASQGGQRPHALPHKENRGPTHPSSFRDNKAWSQPSKAMTRWPAEELSQASSAAWPKAEGTRAPAG